MIGLVPWQAVDEKVVDFDRQEIALRSLDGPPTKVRRKERAACVVG
jgi:hypothetical protein